MALPIPEGFRQLPALGETFNTLVGPLWFAEQGGKLVSGFHVEPRHCNPSGALHGGMTATLADIHMSLAVQFSHDIRAAGGVTVSMTVDYLGAGMVGDWVVSRAEVDRAGGLSFVRTIVTATRLDGSDHVIARASGVFRSIRNIPDQRGHVGNLLREHFGLSPFPAAG